MPERPRVFFPLLTMQLLQLRGEWFTLFLVSLALPMGLVTALTAFPFATTGGQRDLLLGASTLLAPLGGALLVLPGHLAYMRDQGQLRSFAAFPLGRASLLMAWFITFALFTLPGAILTPLWTAHLLHSTASFSWEIAPVWLLSSVTLIAVGGSLGLMGLRHTATLVCGFALYGAMLLGILFLAVPHPSPWARTIALLLPASMSSDLAAACLPLGGGHLVVSDVFFLVLYSSGFAYLAYLRLPWRVEAQPTPAIMTTAQP